MELLLLSFMALVGNILQVSLHGTTSTIERCLPFLGDSAQIVLKRVWRNFVKILTRIQIWVGVAAEGRISLPKGAMHKEHGLIAALV